MCLVQRLYVKGGSKGCFAAVIPRRRVPALDVSARDHTSVFVGVCFVLSVKLCATFFLHGSMFIVQCHAIPHDHPCWCLFAAHTTQQEVSFLSFVLAKAVHWNIMRRFADTVRFRGTSCFSRGGAVHANSLHVKTHHTEHEDVRRNKQWTQQPTRQDV